MSRFRFETDVFSSLFNISCFKLMPCKTDSECKFQHSDNDSNPSLLAHRRVCIPHHHASRSLVAANCEKLSPSQRQHAQPGGRGSKQIQIHSRKLTCNLKRGSLYIAVLPTGAPIKFSVSFPECKTDSGVCPASAAPCSRGQRRQSRLLLPPIQVLSLPQAEKNAKTGLLSRNLN